MISILILTRDEARDLPGALASVAWSSDVHVLDSGSTDGTVALATAAGAKIHQRPFDDYASQRNFGLALPFAHPWIFLLDADERPTAALSAEMQRAVDSLPAGIAAFRIRRRDFLFGTWLKHAQMSPYYLRLVRPELVHFTRTVNEALAVNGAIATLLNPIDHFPFSKGIAHWIERHNRYSSMEAELIHTRQGLTQPSLRTALNDPDFHTRRSHQKALFYKLPCRPLLKLIYSLILRGAILDGYAGVTYAILQSIYEYFIVLKTRELKKGNRG